MKNQNVLNSPRLLELKKKQRKILRRKIFFWIFLFILFLIGLSFLSKWEKININNIQISGNKVLDTEIIKNIVQKNITGYYLWIFPKTNFLLYPKGGIQKELTSEFKRIKDISLGVRNLQILDVSLTERTALYTYCGTTPPEINNTEQKCYFMDDSGYIFDEAPYFSGEVYLKFYGRTDVGLPDSVSPTSGTNPLGSYFFQPNFEKLISFKETLEKIAIKPVIFYVKNNGDIGMFLSSSSASQMGPEIIFETDSDFEKVAENLQTVLTTEPFKSDFKNKYSSLISIDLRFGNKVYYKFK